MFHEIEDNIMPLSLLINLHLVNGVVAFEHDKQVISAPALNGAMRITPGNTAMINGKKCVVQGGFKPNQKYELNGTQDPTTFVFVDPRIKKQVGTCK
jgi:hypothetical protein